MLRMNLIVAALAVQTTNAAAFCLFKCDPLVGAWSRINRGPPATINISSGKLVWKSGAITVDYGYAHIETKGDAVIAEIKFNSERPIRMEITLKDGIMRIPGDSAYSGLWRKQ